LRVGSLEKRGIPVDFTGLAGASDGSIVDWLGIHSMREEMETMMRRAVAVAEQRLRVRQHADAAAMDCYHICVRVTVCVSTDRLPSP